MEALLKKAKGQADQAEVFWITSRDTPITLEANRLKNIETRESTGIGLRILKEKRIGLSSTSRLSDTDGLMARALEALSFGPEAAMELPPAQPYSDVPIYDPETAELTIEAIADLGQGLVDTMHQRWPDVLWDCHLQRTVATQRILNSQGCSAEYTGSILSLFVEGTLVRDTDMLFVMEGQSSCHPITDTSSIIAALDQKLEWAQESVSAPRGKVPVIFTPWGVADLLLEPLLLGFNGRSIVQGTSPLVGKLGEQLLAPSLTIWDDPTIPYIPGSRACDDEGIPSRRLPLVQNGVVSNFLFDLQTAGQAGAQSTGSASRSPGSLPRPDSSVVIIEPGETSFSEMIASQKEALIVESLLGAGQGNILGGDFSANVLLGYRVEEGAVVGRVKNTVIAGNVYQALTEIEALGAETQWIGGSLQSPAICCRGVTVSRND